MGIGTGTGAKIGTGIGKGKGINKNELASVVQKVDSAIHRTNLYPVDKAIGFPKTYLLHSAIQRLNNQGLETKPRLGIRTHSIKTTSLIAGSRH